MTLFESSLRKLNLPKCVMDDIVAIRNICMEAEQPQQQKPTQPAQPQAAQNQNATTPQNNPQQTPPQANAQAKTAPQQGQAQPNAQGNTQAQGQQQGNQANKQAPQQENNLTEDQIDSNKLMGQFNNYLKGCQENVKKALATQFGENANAIINEVNQYVKSNSPINFDEEIVPLLKVNGKIADQKVVEDVKQRLQKYFGLKVATAEQEPNENTQEQAQPQQQNAAQANKQPAQPQGQKQPAQPAVQLRSLSH